MALVPPKGPVVELTGPITAGRPPMPRWRPSAALRNWLLCWIVLPNAAFCVLWAIAAPPRTAEILLIAVTGLVVRRAPYWVRLLGFSAAMTFGVLSYISAIFNLAIASLVPAMRFFAELDPLRSPVYSGAFALMLAITAIAAWLLRRDMRFEGQWDLVVAIVATLAMAGVDGAVARASSGSYKRLPSAGTPFASAVEASGFATGATPGRNLMIVVVEALGAPVDPALDNALLGRWRRPDILARYAVTSGTTAYYGSTTNAEVRELCGEWGDYGTFMREPAPQCLPAQLRAKGYRTTAIHGFTGRFFDRIDWYPNVGFTDLIFGERMLRDGAPECPGVFPGACDRAIPEILKRRLRRATTPQFVYWLTLNSHLPVPAEDRLGTRDCRLGTEAGSGLCRLVHVVATTNDSLARTLTARDMPATDVLIVGDHMPPFFDHRTRSRFRPDAVPWILLRARTR